MEDHLNDVMASIKKAILDSISDIDRIAILFSGGLDSSLLAHIAKDGLGKSNISLYTVGTPDSQDIENAQSAAKLLDLDIDMILVKAQDIRASLPEVSKVIGSQHPVKLSYELPLFLGMAKVSEKHVLSGQGADELFGGYARYLKMTETELEVALNKDYENLISQDIKMDHKVARHFDRTLITPYLDDSVVRSAQRTPVRYKVSEGQRKIILKDAANELELPKELTIRQKKSVQYSSGIIKELKKMAREQDIGVNELLKTIIHDNSV
jgi:asparagine synthase (glutamine-hydrolysing)